jgi:TolB-like protein/DNA-binding winged helix-turn-helix (wHTH) protein
VADLLMRSRKFRFEGWVLDPESGDLERDGTRIRLQEQPVEVLQALLLAGGSIVTREQLIALLWPKGVVDFDAGLNTIIRKLRSALGDTSDTPRYIETLPRRGYRFVGSFDPEPEEPSASSPGVSTALQGDNPAAGQDTPVAEVSSAPTRHPQTAALPIVAALAVAALLIGAYSLWRSRPEGSTSVRLQSLSQPATTATASSFAPPPHSIAVIPFVNLSGEKEQQYFSDGLTEELLNSLVRIEGLQVAAATSSFPFGQHADAAQVAHKLNVGKVLEGSVRRSGHTVRVTAQLVDAITGFHIWSKTYDRDLGDVLKLQTEIASAVATALEVTLAADWGAKVEPGGTRDSAAFDAYLRASQQYESSYTAKDLETSIATFNEAIRLDPQYAQAFAGRATALIYQARAYTQGAASREDIDKSLADARNALALAPNLAEAHLAMAAYLVDGALDFDQASKELARAVALAPSNALALGRYGSFTVLMGHQDAGVAAARRAVVLDPLNAESHYRLGHTLYYARRYAESVAAFDDALMLDPRDTDSPAWRAIAYFSVGDFQKAKASCEAGPDNSLRLWCLALTDDKLGLHTDAEAAVAKLKSAADDRWAYRCATIYAQWGNAPQALAQLETALRVRVPELRSLKADPLLDVLRNEPRFQAIERTLKFPT